MFPWRTRYPLSPTEKPQAPSPGLDPTRRRPEAEGVAVIPGTAGLQESGAEGGEESLQNRRLVRMLRRSQDDDDGIETSV